MVNSSSSPYRPHQLGKAGEAAAVAYLIDAGYSIINQNWRGAHGEIDIIARCESHHPEFVVVEVTTRSSLQCGTPLEAVTSTKYRRLFLLGREWISTYQPGALWRIDVLALLRSASGFHITHHKGLIA